MGSNNPGNSTPIAGALTYPASAEGAQPVPIQPRQPRNLQGLLRFAMEATKAEDAPGNSNLGPMDEERRKFLEEALRSLTVNVSEVIENAIKVLTNTERMHSIQLGEELPEDVKNAFTVLLEYIDDIDVANDFYKMGGFAVFPIAYGSENAEIRTLANSVLGELCQNNPYCQAKALECGLVNVLLNLVQTEHGDALTKCIYAISCATREFGPACRELIAQSGCATLAQLLKSPETSARTKAAFLVRYFCQHYPNAKEQFIRLNIVETIAEKIKSGRDSSTEHLLSILKALMEDCDSTVFKQCRSPSCNMKKVLEDHLKHPDLVDDTFKEEKECCKGLLHHLGHCGGFPLQDPVEEAADR